MLPVADGYAWRRARRVQRRIPRCDEFCRPGILVALLDHCTDLRVSDFPLVLQLVGRELRDYVDHTPRDAELKPVSRLDAGLAADALRHHDFTFGVECDIHDM